MCVAFDPADDVAAACAAASLPVVSTRWLTVSALHWRVMDAAAACWRTLGSAAAPPARTGSEAEVLQWLQAACLHPCAHTPADRRVTLAVFQQLLSFLRGNEEFATGAGKALADLQVRCCL